MNLESIINLRHEIWHQNISLSTSGRQNEVIEVCNWCFCQKVALMPLSLVWIFSSIIHFVRIHFHLSSSAKTVYLSSLSVQFSTKQCLHSQVLKTSLALFYLSGKVRMSTLSRTKSTYLLNLSFVFFWIRKCLYLSVTFL